MNGNKIVILLYFVAVLGYSLAQQHQQNLSHYQSGTTTIFFQTNSQNRDFQQSEEIFTISPLKKYSTQSQVTVTISGFQLDSSLAQESSLNTLSVATLLASMEEGHKLKIMAKQMGGIVKLQINYLIIQLYFQHQMGLLIWDSSNKNKQPFFVNQMALSIEQELIQIEQLKSQDRQMNQTTRNDQNYHEIQILQLSSTLAVRSGQILQLLDLRLITHQQRTLIKVGIPSEIYLQGMPLAYKLLVIKPIGSILEYTQKYVKIIDRIHDMSPNSPLMFQFTQKEESMVFGLISLKSECTGLSTLLYEQRDSIQTISVAQAYSQKQSQCTYTIHIVGLQLIPITFREMVPARLLSTCSAGTYYGLNNYISLSTDSKPTAYYQCPWWLSWWCQSSCKACPIGCSACSKMNCNSWHVSCNSCSTGFTKLSTGTCSGQTYCACPANLFPSASTNTCLPCTTVIPNCLSCNTNFFIGTFCASCNTSYYPTYNSATSGYARGCAPCSPGCKNCTSSAACLTCANNLVIINSACTCNTSQSLYYNANTASCTSCSTAISNCNTCSLSGSTTSCTQCKTGYYVDTATKTCLLCSTYCSVCTPTACTTCASTTFTIVGATCVCTSPLFLNTSSSPPSCSACTNFQPNCQACTNSGGSILCSSCNPGHYAIANPGACSPCISNCLSCTSGSSCDTCKTNFTYNLYSNLCECSPGYVSYGTDSCIECNSLIPGCQTCGPNGLYCETCADPYYNSTVNGLTCTLCPLECSSCTSPGTGACDGCITGYDLVSGSCVCNNCPICEASTGVSNCSSCYSTTCITCSVGYYYNSANTNCTSCPSGCSSCTSATTCSTCSSPFIYVSPNCVCNNALQSYYDPLTQTCTTCSMIYSNCTSCTGQVSLGSISSTSCTACTTGSYLLNPTTCSLCPPTCLQCSSATSCSSCPPTFYIINGICNCDTNSQYFLNQSSNACQFCSTMLPFCLICQVNTSTVSKVGCFECELGYYIDSADSCSMCPSTCISCTSSTTCSSCKDTYSMINGSCICDASKQLYNTGSECLPCYTFFGYCTQCVSSGTVTCASCVAGSYLNTPLNTTCILCPSNCNQCDSLGCTTCILGFASISGVCVFTNDCQNYAGADPNCASCNTTIINSTSTIICQGCLTGFYLVDNVFCLPCPSTCQSCSDYSVCLICSPTFTYVDGVCTCDTLSNQVLFNSQCVSCGSLITSCQACNSTEAPVACTQCLPTFYLDISGSCLSCLSGCISCYQNGSCTNCMLGFTFDPVALTCTDSTFCSPISYYNGTSCQLCPSGCSSCLNSLSCLGCDPTYSLINGVCRCDTLSGLFFSPQTATCNQCGSYDSLNYGVNYTLNCLTCVNSTTYSLAGFECLICQTGYYVSLGQCYPCQPGCDECSGSSNCYKCTPPYFILNSAGGCECNAIINYFLNGTECDLCVLENCTICLNINTCQNCTPGSFVNSTILQCQPEICGNGRREGVQQCDDGNLIDGDGCDMFCSFEQYYVCGNLVQGSLSVCQSQSNKFKLQIVEQSVTCNKIAFKLLNIGTQSITQCNINNLMPSYQFPNATLQSFSMDGRYVTYQFTYNQTVQNQMFHFVFDPTTLCIANALSFPPFNITTTVSPTNNQIAMYYEQALCSSQSTAQSVVNTIQYASYAALFISAVPSKIVGLQLFGVLQLAYLTIGSMDNVNLLLQPLADMANVNGYRLDLGNDKRSRLLQIFTPQRINALDYKANFIRNCNVMFVVVVSVMVVAFVLYIISHIYKNCSPNFVKVTKRLCKEVLLTLILFNQFNFAYSAGIHFKYAPKDDPLYMMGTIAAAGTLVIPVVMAIALLMTQDQGFGQFKERLKRGCVQRAYFVVTILYRMGIGIYMASANEDPLSTLIILAISLLFLVYNLVNLPFTKAYHNYRANICHLTQFIILFVAMYYRSMKSTTPSQETTSLFGPVYIEYIFIIASVIVSILVLVYQIYLFIKQCCTKRHEQKQENQGSDQIDPNQSIKKIQQREITMIKVEDVEEIYRSNKRVDTINPLYDEFS